MLNQTSAASGVALKQSLVWGWALTPMLGSPKINQGRCCCLQWSCCQMHSSSTDFNDFNNMTSTTFCKFK
jgi:hypothetical protein